MLNDLDKKEKKIQSSKENIQHLYSLTVYAPRSMEACDKFDSHLYIYDWFNKLESILKLTVLSLLENASLC